MPNWVYRLPIIRYFVRRRALHLIASAFARGLETPDRKWFTLKMSLKPTDEQLHILDLVRTSSAPLMINALAGTGKTSTLRMIDNQIAGKEGILYLVFNKRNQEEASETDSDGNSKFNSTTTIRTLNSQGHRMFAAQIGKKLVLDGQKTQNLLRSAIGELHGPDKTEAWENYSVIINSVGRAKALGYIPDGKFPTGRRLVSAKDFFCCTEEILSDLARELVDRVLCESIQTAFRGNIDYNDQLYMPTLFGTSFPKFPIVLVDEAQDLSPINHEMLSRLTTHSRTIAVGDPWQSIYNFRGAVQDGMSALREKFNMVECDLSISFRCPEAIVKAVHWHVPKLKWSKPGGRAGKILNPTLRGFPDNSAIICRNNAPLFSLGLRLLAAKRSVSIAGSDIGPKIVGIMRKLGDESDSKVKVLDEIEAWREDKLSKQSTTADDTADCMRVFASFGETLSQALGYAEHLFAQKGGIHLLTGHKSKGLEWHTVYHMDPSLCGDFDQDKNLRYVITTRAADTLYEFETKDLR
jgi:superfamily I DNA/RNA helicase